MRFFNGTIGTNGTPLTPDVLGGYDVNLMVLDASNQHDVIYSSVLSIKAFEEGSKLHNNIIRGTAYLGWQRPPIPKTKDPVASWDIASVTPPDLVCGRITALSFVNSVQSNKNVVKVMGNIIPCGPYREDLIRLLETRSGNVMFGLRGLSKTSGVENSNIIKEIIDVFSFDIVR